jgi:hypothetical protein
MHTHAPAHSSPAGWTRDETQIGDDTAGPTQRYLELPPGRLIDARVADAHTQGPEPPVRQLLHRGLHTGPQLIRVVGHVQQNLGRALGHLWSTTATQSVHAGDHAAVLRGDKGASWGRHGGATHPEHGSIMNNLHRGLGALVGRVEGNELQLTESTQASPAGTSNATAMHSQKSRGQGMQ